MEFANFTPLDDSIANGNILLANATVDVTIGVLFKKTTTIRIVAEKCKYGIMSNLWQDSLTGATMPCEVWKLEKAYYAKRAKYVL